VVYDGLLAAFARANNEITEPEPEWKAGAAANVRSFASGERTVLKLQRSSNGQVVFTISGRIGEDNIAELETLTTSESEASSIALDLKDVTIVNQDAVKFLERCEAAGITLKNCPAYIREWITRQQKES
jgi:hypothetical protein